MRPIDSGIAVLFLAGAAEVNPIINIGEDYSANVSTFTTGSDLGYTRFGSNSSWGTLSISDGDPNDATEAAILDDAGALARYQMPPFLVSQYQTNQGSNAYNNGIQVAMWDIFDPSSSPTASNHANADKALEQAAEWYSNPNSSKRFLSDFRIVSHSTMSWTGAGGPPSGGIQEQLAMVTRPVPEPRIAVWMLIGSFSILACLRRPASAMKAPVAKRLFSWDLPNQNANVPVLAPGTRTSTH